MLKSVCSYYSRASIRTGIEFAEMFLWGAWLHGKARKNSYVEVLVQGIDAEMVEIVQNLNEIGLETKYSCQGNHEGGDIGIAYISFSEGVRLPEKMLAYVRQQNWQIELDYHNPPERDGVVYSIHSVACDFPEDIPELKKRNDAFIRGWKSFLMSI